MKKRKQKVILPEVGMPVTWRANERHRRIRNVIQKDLIPTYGAEEASVRSVENPGRLLLVTLERGGKPLCFQSEGLRNKPAKFNWGFLQPAVG